ncbi:hypothetical protein ENSA5_04940 [Enhygromyxa salina]|uniref:Uncharacterized protein n=1 Tax=Enhygromyxa salina TaxID=215803 RepID=A0A2S9YI25_9BACT|nr:hypothetical protein [Enhygromyxa salina]PRQ04729.1 hypothetical protein ENSA5_04940 [Enhygromyxa salina]
MSAAQPPTNAQVPWILWGAFLVSHGLFLLTGHIVHGQDSGQAGDIEMMSLVLTGAGAMTAVGSAVLAPGLTRRQPYFVSMIMRFALAESAALFGLVLAMLGAEFHWVYTLAGLGAVAHLAAAPTQREREAHEKRRAGL